MEGDRNFDDLADKFRRKVYGRLKGRIRLAVLERDLGECCPRALTPADDRPLRILDAGSGHAPFSLILADNGHDVTLCDVSRRMLDMAEDRVAAKGLSHRVGIRNCAIQDLAWETTGRFDLVLCHAVLGWVARPRALIRHLLDLTAPGGILSLVFYNLNGMIYKNLLRANYKKILNEAYNGWPGSLTPTWPRQPETVLEWLEQEGVDVRCHSGIRVFHDYNLDPVSKEAHPDTVVELELRFSRQMPYRDLGRYQHVVACVG